MILVCGLTLAASRTASATWSIIIVDPVTREVAIGSATCLSGYDLRAGSPVVLAAVGAAAAQSYLDVSGANRLLIRDQLKLGTGPAQILNLLAKADPRHQWRQYGIVDVKGGKVGFTGSRAGAYAHHLVGQVGNLHYAIQGNVLTGSPVLTKAEEAIKTTKGDLAEKLMAAMEAARGMGGDGRCSCSPSNPTGCGSPPASFTKSAHIGYMIVAREGDQDGPCNAGVGCAAGVYFLNLNIAFKGWSAPDPVFQLRSQFGAWRVTWLGRPDHLLSTVTFHPPGIPADGKSITSATLVLRDWQGTQLSGGGAKVTVSADPSSTAPVQIGKVLDLGKGTYTFPVTAGTTPGLAVFRIEVDDGRGKVLLAPRSILTVSKPPLFASPTALSAAAGGTVNFDLFPGPAFAGRPFYLLASASGSVPGIPLPGLTLPLNPDPLFFLSFSLMNSPILPGAAGKFDASGRASARLVVTPGLLLPYASGSLTFAYGVLNPIDFVSNPVVIAIHP